MEISLIVWLCFGFIKSFSLWTVAHSSHQFLIPCNQPGYSSRRQTSIAPHDSLHALCNPHWNLPSMSPTALSDDYFSWTSLVLVPFLCQLLSFYFITFPSAAAQVVTSCLFFFSISFNIWVLLDNNWVLTPPGTVSIQGLRHSFSEESFEVPNL